jgi:hypothetical protein
MQSHDDHLREASDDRSAIALPKPHHAPAGWSKEVDAVR